MKYVTSGEVTEIQMELLKKFCLEASLSDLELNVINCSKTSNTFASTVLNIFSSREFLRSFIIKIDEDEDVWDYIISLFGKLDQVNHERKFEVHWIEYTYHRFNIFKYGSLIDMLKFKEFKFIFVDLIKKF